MDASNYRVYAMEMVRKRFIPIDGILTPEMEDIFKECIMLARQDTTKSYTLLINSDGGNDLVMTSIKAAITLSNLTFNGIVTGKAYSNAFRILQMCKVRYAYAGAEVIVHWGSYNLSNHEIGALMRGERGPIDHIISQRQLLIDEISQRTGLSASQIREFADTERQFTAEEAKKLNMIDEIIDHNTYSLNNKADT